MRLFRMSFTGELGYEVNVSADYGLAVWEAIHAAGQPHGITPYGTETMHVLRAEKGYIIVGQETDGTVTPDDAGPRLGHREVEAGFRRQAFARARERCTLPDRKQLVGLLTVDPKVVLEEGAQVVATPGQHVPMKMIGHVTSAYHSVVLGRSIALALVRGGRARIGETLYVPMPGGDIAVQVTATGVLRRRRSATSWLIQRFAARVNLPTAAWLESPAPATRFILRGAAAARAAAGQGFGLSLPETACRATTDGNRAALWLGPDEQLLLAPDSEVDTIEAALARALQGHACSLVDVSHRQVGFSIHGPHAQSLLRVPVPAAAQPARFPGQACARARCSARPRSCCGAPPIRFSGSRSGVRSACTSCSCCTRVAREL